MHFKGYHLVSIMLIGGQMQRYDIFFSFLRCLQNNFIGRMTERVSVSFLVTLSDFLALYKLGYFLRYFLSIFCNIVVPALVYRKIAERQITVERPMNVSQFRQLCLSDYTLPVFEGT